MKQTEPKDAIDSLVVDFVMICIQVSFKFHELMEKKLYISWKLPIPNELNWSSQSVGKPTKIGR